MASEPHILTVELDEDGSVDTASLQCTATDASYCRQWCVDGCEEECTGWPPLPAGTEVVAQAPVAGHRWGPVGRCREVEWIECSSVEESRADEEPYRAGSHPVALEWDGDTYLWSYAEDAA